jgi:hypothetical protein
MMAVDFGVTMNRHYMYITGMVGTGGMPTAMDAYM